ncbi:MAG: hypothetical protein ACLSHM_01185 [Vescimonas sp.]
MEQYDIQWGEGARRYLSVLDYKKQEREKEIAALDTTLAEKQDELEAIAESDHQLRPGRTIIERLERQLVTEEFQLPEPPALMTAEPTDGGLWTR